MIRHDFLWVGRVILSKVRIGWTSDSDKCSKRLQLDLISLLVNLSCELLEIMIRYDFIWARRMILRNVRTDSNFT